MSDRKPQPSAKESAQVVLNKFLKENGILLGISPQTIEQTQSGQIIISAPKQIAVYADEINKKDKTVN